MPKKHIRPIRVDGQLAYVTLTKGYAAVIDAADVPLVEGFNWTAMVKKRRDGEPRSVYATRNDRSGQKQRSVLLHRVIAGTPEGMDTDHIDGDGLNNRRSNLRHATTSQNIQNQRIAMHNTSGVKGVHWFKRDEKWRAEIQTHGKTRHLGLFETIEAAAAAYARASAELHGAFGRTR